MKLDIIPVIDIRGGLVVRAVMGRRHLYRPIETPLARSAEPVDIASGLLRLHAFGKLYLADLDAIEGRGDNTLAIAKLRQHFPYLEIWTDNGAAGVGGVRNWLDGPNGTLVLGSESQTSSVLVREFVDEPRIVLSLDFRTQAFQGPPELLDPSHWPQRVIAMTLARIGSVAGPDFERLAELSGLGAKRSICMRPGGYAAERTSAASLRWASRASSWRRPCMTAASAAPTSPNFAQGDRRPLARGRLPAGANRLGFQRFAMQTYSAAMLGAGRKAR